MSRARSGLGDDGGELTGVAVLAVADRQNGGGTVLVLPPESRTGGGSLVDAYAAGGEAGKELGGDKAATLQLQWEAPGTAPSR